VVLSTRHWREEPLTSVRPTLVRRISPQQTDITWSDGHFSSYPSWYLRENCPCATCVEEFTGRRLLQRGSIPSSLERVAVETVGNYALSFRWSDGHSTGIYTFQHLRRLCPCPHCLPQGLEPPPKDVLPRGSFEV
jgi:DUF971 family protein